MRKLLDLLAEEERATFEALGGLDLDNTLARAESFLELRQDVERNVSADLILEKTLKLLAASTSIKR